MKTKMEAIGTVKPADSKDQSQFAEDVLLFCEYENSRNYLPEEMFALTKRLLDFWKNGLFLNVSTQKKDVKIKLQRIFTGFGDQDGVSFVKRVADINRIYKNTIAPAFTSGDSAVLLALCKFRVHPRRQEMFLTMKKAFDERDHEFFFLLAKKLDCVGVAYTETDQLMVRVASRYWLKHYRCEDGTIIPPLSHLDDQSRCNVLMRLTGNRNWTPVAVRRALERAGLPEPLPTKGKKQRRGKKLPESIQFLDKIKRES